MPPFTSLYVGEIIDEAEEQEYVILVRRKLVQGTHNERWNVIVNSAQQVRCGARTFLDGHQG